MTTTMTQTCNWIGASRKSYTYHIYQLPPRFDAKPGNYIFAKLNSSGQWQPVYIGQTEDLSERFENHHAMPCIRQNSATHIHAHVNGDGKKVRLAEETDLIANYNPPCNKT